MNWTRPAVTCDRSIAATFPPHRPTGSPTPEPSSLLWHGTPAPAAITHETPDTSFEREAFALVQLLEQQPDTIRSCFSLPACAERALTGLRLNPRLAQRFGTNLLACFEENVADPVAGAANFKIVAFHRAGAEPRFLCRAAQRDGSVSYLDLIVERSRLAGCAVVDAFDYSAGVKLSEIARGSIEARAQESQKSDHQRLLGSRSELSKFANAIDQFQQLARNGDFAGALAVYAKLPPAAQKERLILRTQIRCATPTDLPACSAALALRRTTFPNDIATDLLVLGRRSGTRADAAWRRSTAERWGRATGCSAGIG